MSVMTEPAYPAARAIAPRIHAMNDAVRASCAKTGVRLLDFAELPLATDPRLWDEDRIHANPAGHARIADALAQELGLPDANADWRQPLPPLAEASLIEKAWRELRWWLRYYLRWQVLALLARRQAGAFPGRRPELEPL